MTRKVKGGSRSTVMSAARAARLRGNEWLTCVGAVKERAMGSWRRDEPRNGARLRRRGHWLQPFRVGQWKAGRGAIHQRRVRLRAMPAAKRGVGSSTAISNSFYESGMPHAALETLR